ncbi:MAG: alpha-glucosidase C-terminal domain-containing protein, partial [Clostridiales bacterium]|nr:alpha-glucosidase C-terminal domain-containing protein [Clostridiales bacterium]
AGMIHLMRGTPYVYQGEEIGMTNPHFASIDQYRDVESLNYYRILCEQGKTEEEAMQVLAARSRDNGRTPMQWNKGKNGGFSDAEPWIPMADNAESICVQSQMEDRESVLAFYKKLIALRKKRKIISEGTIQFQEEADDHVIAYRRNLGEEELLVYGNLSGTVRTVSEKFPDGTYQKILGNYEGEPEMTDGRLTLRPYELVVMGR